MNAFSSIYWVFIEPTSCNACSRNICSTQVYITIVQRLQLKIINSKFFSIFDEKIVLIFFVLFLSISFLTYPFVNKSVWYPWCFSVGCQALDLDAWMPGCQSLAVSFICILSSCQYWQLAVWLSRLWVHWSPGFSPTLSGYQDSMGAFQPKLQLQYMHFAHTLGVKFQHLLILRFQLLQLFTTVHFILLPLWSIYKKFRFKRICFTYLEIYFTPLAAAKQLQLQLFCNKKNVEEMSNLKI